MKVDPNALNVEVCDGTFENKSLALKEVLRFLLHKAWEDAGDTLPVNVDEIYDALIADDFIPGKLDRRRRLFPMSGEFWASVPTDEDEARKFVHGLIDLIFDEVEADEVFDNSGGGCSDSKAESVSESTSS